MRDEDFTYDESRYEEFDSEEIEDFEEEEEMEPEMQGFMAGYKKAGRYRKEEKSIEEVEDFW